MINEEFIKKVILIVLVILSVLLGIVIYNRNSDSPVKSSSSDTIPKIDNMSFSEDEIKLLAPPGPDSTKTEKDEHSKLAAKLAVIGNEIELKDCKAGPIVLQTKLGSDIKFKNSSSYPITISFDENNTLNIKSGETVVSSKPFIHGYGLYGYLCKGADFTGLVGFIILTP